MATEESEKKQRNPKHRSSQNGDLDFRVSTIFSISCRYFEALEDRCAAPDRKARSLSLCASQVIAAMGGGHEVGHGAHYPGYPTGVWSPTGGWWCDPKLWRRNTALTMLGIFAVCIPIAMKSAQLEQRPVPPIRPIPSQKWCKNFGPPITQD